MAVADLDLVIAHQANQRILDAVGTPNPAPVHNGAAFWFKISAQQDGSFSNEDQKRFQQKVRDKELIC